MGLTRKAITDAIGIEPVSNIEAGEFSYQKAFKEKGLKFVPIKSKKGSTYKDLDIRFVKDNVSVLVETKQDYFKDFSSAKEQLRAYMEYEKSYMGNSQRIIGVLANTDDKASNKVFVYRFVLKEGDKFDVVESENTSVMSMGEYVELAYKDDSGKAILMYNTTVLNKILHKNGVLEKLRSQFVGSCLLTLQKNLQYTELSDDTFKVKFIHEVYEYLSDIRSKYVDKNGNFIFKENISNLSEEHIEDLVDANNVNGSFYKVLIDFLFSNGLRVKISEYPYVKPKKEDYHERENDKEYKKLLSLYDDFVKLDKKASDDIEKIVNKILDKNYSAMILDRITGQLSSLLGKNDTVRKEEKIQLLSKNVFENQCIKDLSYESWQEILVFIDVKIKPFIDITLSNFEGQDLMNLFFVTFNKYVGKADKNQAFTPDHITDFMSRVVEVNRYSRVLDFTCGSGSFLVKAMMRAAQDIDAHSKENNLGKIEKEALQKKFARENVFGIEYEEKAYGLSVTNMLLHRDGNSNILKASCFDCKDWIQTVVRPNVILLNPPYNCLRVSHCKEYVDTWDKKVIQDPSKGLYFVKWISDVLEEMWNNWAVEDRDKEYPRPRTAKMAVLLPVSCAISDDSEIASLREYILKNNTLDAVFSLPNEMFYPGASASACCMVFTLGVPHKTTNKKTFFGYFKEDGFKKKKNLGRVEQSYFESGKELSVWAQIDENNKLVGGIENDWLELYRNKTVKAGMSAVEEIVASRKVKGDDGKEKIEYPEWICEAYMETDYSKLTQEDFQRTINNYLAFLVKEGKIYEPESSEQKVETI